MTKEQLAKEAEEYIKKNYVLYSISGNDIDLMTQAYLAGTEPREKRIAELKAQIEKMKCCGNCHHHFFNSYDVMECAEGLNVTSKHCDKWECRL